MSEDTRRWVFESSNDRNEIVDILTGSRADGLDPEADILDSDYDIMWVLPLSTLEVNIKHQTGYYIECEKDEPTHVTVRAGTEISDHPGNTTLHGKHYLSADVILQSNFKGVNEEGKARRKYIHGPACRVEYGAVSVDLICSVACKTPFEDMYSFADRRKSEAWLQHISHSRICYQRGLLVSKPYTNCDGYKKNILFCKSFSVQEMLLFQSIPKWVRQAAIAFKYVVKRAIADCSSSEQKLCSYHTKTVTMWALEKMSDDACRHEHSSRLLKIMLKRFLSCLDDHNLPHYWIPASNLFEDLTYSYTRECSEAIRNVKSRLLECVLELYFF